MNLTEAAYWTRRWAVLAVVGVIAVFLFWQLIEFIIPDPKIPERYLIANNLCSTEPLPTLVLEEIDVPADFTNIEIETTTGRYPDLPTIVNVYKVDYRAGSLTAKEIAQSMAEAFGFDPDSVKKKSASEYLFQDSRGRTMIVESSNQNFDLTTDLTQVDTSNISIDADDKTTELATRLLNAEGLLSDNYDDSLTLVRYLVVSGSSYTETASRISAHFARVDFFESKELVAVEEKYIKAKELGEYLQKVLPESPKKRMKIDGEDVEARVFSVPLVPDQPYSSNIYVIIKGQEAYAPDFIDLMEIHYINWTVEDDPCGTYELIGEDVAMEKIKDGEGYLVDLRMKGSQTLDAYPAGISITGFRVFDITLAYLDTAKVQDYLQPVYVVEGEADTNKGKADYIIYVPAIKRE